MTTTITAPQESQAPEVAALSEETRQEIVALRESGMTVAELKARFPQLTSEQIRDVLPAGNARERKAKAAKTEVVKGVGGHSGKAKSEAKPPKVEAPKPAPTPRYVEDADLLVSLSERTLACRQVMGAAPWPRRSTRASRPCGAPSRAASTRTRSTASRPARRR